MICTRQCISAKLTWCQQNLLPLLLRPLRLFIAPDDLRACRITLLKVTHWPLVALILAYENCRRLFQHQKETGIIIGSTKPGLTPSLMRRQTSSRSTEPLSLTETPESELDGQASVTSDNQFAESSTRASKSQDRLKTLETLATSLRAQLLTVEGLIESEKAQGYSKNSPEA